MISGLLVLLGLIFGGGSIEYFYIAEFEKSINKYVDNKERKKELRAHSKDYQKAVKEYKKQHKSQIELFKEKNLDINTTKEDYLNLFNELGDLREERQAKAISFRLSIQPLINDDEWQNIVSAGKKATSKALKKEKNKTAKKNKTADNELKQTAEKYISDAEKNKGISEAYDEFKEKAIILEDAYDKLNLVDNSLLTNKSATRTEMEQLADSFNALRLEMYPTYLDFINELNEITSDKEWEAIMKDLNKAIKSIKEQ